MSAKARVNPLELAFGIVTLVPKGGLQIDCLRLARILRDRGHRVVIFTSRLNRQIDPALEVAMLPVRALSNHGYDLSFARKFAARTRGRFDVVVGFNKLVDLDVYYCADPSVQDRHRNPWQRVFPRHYAQLRLEGACFAPSSKTHVLALTEASIDRYRQHWRTPPERFTLLPPALDPARRRPELRSPEHRDRIRSLLGITGSGPVWLWIGTKPRTKGLDRVMTALAGAPAASLLVMGVDPSDGDGRQALLWAQQAGVTDRVRLLGYREDVPQIMAAADWLVHPARLDTTGQVILEAIANGLPIIASEACGFAKYIREADAGIVLSEPFSQAELAAALSAAADPVRSARCSQNGAQYGNAALPVAGLYLAADCIERQAVRAGSAPAA